MCVNVKVLLYLLILLSYPIYSVNAEIFPRGCELKDFGYENDRLILNSTGQQSFYLIQNRSNREIRLQRVELRDIFISPPLTAKISAMNWAAFASDVENFNFQCFILENDNAFPIDCQNVIDICKYPRARFAKSNMGNYWVSINKLQQQVLNDAVTKGIYLKW